MRRDGTVLDPGGIAIPGATNAWIVKPLVFDGTQYSVFWRPQTQSGAPNYLEGGRVGLDGASSKIAGLGAGLGRIDVMPSSAASSGSGQYLLVSSGASYEPGRVTARFLSLLEGFAAQIAREGNGVRVSWNAQSGKNYRVQFKDALNEPVWSNSGSELKAAGSSLSVVDEILPARPRRFYRVVEAP